MKTDKRGRGVWVILRKDGRPAYGQFGRLMSFACYRYAAANCYEEKGERVVRGRLFAPVSGKVGAVLKYK